MRLECARSVPGRIEFGIIYGMIAVLALVAGRFLPLLDLAPACLFKKMTGLPCPTCGSTRSIVNLAHADFSSALAMNPLLTVGFCVVIVLFVSGIIRRIFDFPAIRIGLSDKEKDTVRVAAVLVILANWLYLLFTL